MPVISSAAPATSMASRQLHQLPAPEAHEGAEEQWHHDLRYAATEIPPAGRGRVRSPHDAGREHHRRVVLRDDERSADGADGKTENQK